MNSQITHTQVAIIGGGLTGLCTAYFLAQSGIEVTVFEAHNNVAEEGTLGNSGLLAPASTTPLILPSVFPSLIASHFRSTTSVLSSAKPSFARWMWQRKSYLAGKNHYQALKEILTQLNAYGVELVHDIQENHQLEEENTIGVFKIFRKQEELKRFQQTEAYLKEHKLPFKKNTPAEITAVEPAFEASSPLLEAVFFPKDASGNCVLFAKQLKFILQEMGVEICYDHEITSVEKLDSGKVQLNTRDRQISADIAIICAGHNSAHLVKPLGITLPVQRAESYLAVSTLKSEEYIPNYTFIDDTYRIAMTKLGNRVRISGLISFIPPAQTIPSKVIKSLMKFAQDFFPHSINYDNFNVVSRTFAFTSNGLPLVGTTDYGNIFINTAHGPNGWATAAATSKLLSESLLAHNKDMELPSVFTHFSTKE